MKNLEPDERETTISCTDGDAEVRIWTAQRRFITKLRHNPNFTQTGSGYFGSTEWAQFTIPAERWNPATGAKRVRSPLTDERREALAKQLEGARGVVGLGSGPVGSVSQADDGRENQK